MCFFNIIWTAYPFIQIFGDLDLDFALSDSDSENLWFHQYYISYSEKA